MPSIDRNIYSSDTNRAQKSAKIHIEFACANLFFLRKIDKKNKFELALNSFVKMLRNHEPFTEIQMKYIQDIYEKTWKSLGEVSCDQHIDKKPKGVRY